MLALPTAKPGADGPGRGRQRHPLQPDPRRSRTRPSASAFILEKHNEYAEGIDVFKIANANAVEAVVPANELRADLTRRLGLYSKRKMVPVERRQAVTPV